MNLYNANRAITSRLDRNDVIIEEMDRKLGLLTRRVYDLEQKDRPTVNAVPSMPVTPVWLTLAEVKSYIVWYMSAHATREEKEQTLYSPVKYVFGNNKKIEAIKEVRRFTNVGLKEAKDAVEAWMEDAWLLKHPEPEQKDEYIQIGVRTATAARNTFLDSKTGMFYLLNGMTTFSGRKVLAKMQLDINTAHDLYLEFVNGRVEKGGFSCPVWNKQSEELQRLRKTTSLF